MSGPLRVLGTALVVLGLATLTPASATALLSLPGGDTLLNGSFDEIGYGATGTAYVTPLLYVGELSSTEPPESIDTVTDLSHEYLVDGLGTSLMLIRYSIRNDGVLPFTDLRFLVDVQADGSSAFTDLVDVVFGAAVVGDPDGFQVGDFGVLPLTTALVSNDGTDGSNACGAAVCDADLALEWDLPVLNPGFTWEITVGLSDDGTAISTRYLRATSAETADTSLVFSGAARIVPEPTTVLLVALGLVALGGAGRRAT